MQWHSDLFKFDLSVPKIWGHCIGHMGLSLPGAIEVCEEVTLRLMLTAFISVCPSSSFFAPPGEEVFKLPFPAPVPELEALWLGVLTSGVG